MFVSMWMIFLVSGLIMAVFTVVWGIRARQFDDQDRARYIPLAGLSAEEIANRPNRRHRAEYAGMVTMLAAGFLALCAGLLLALKHM